MIRVMTLGTLSSGQTPETMRARIEPLRQGGIDLICCQNILRAGIDQTRACAEASRRLSESLGLTCSCFAASRRVRPDRTDTVNGLAVLTGTGVWMLNSGSFAVGEGEEETVVQFALTRKNGASVLALNLHLAASPQAQARQLGELFVHPLLKDPYGAVVLCADRPAALTFKEWQVLAARSNYAPQRDLIATAEDGLLCLLTARTGAVSVVTVRQPETLPDCGRRDAAGAVGLSMEFEIQRMTQDKRNRPYFPLSFREQWLGYKDHRAFA